VVEGVNGRNVSKKMGWEVFRSTARHFSTGGHLTSAWRRASLLRAGGRGGGVVRESWGTAAAHQQSPLALYWLYSRPTPHARFRRHQTVRQTPDCCVQKEHAKFGFVTSNELRWVASNTNLLIFCNSMSLGSLYQSREQRFRYKWLNSPTLISSAQQFCDGRDDA
jgi:hypothetical protein